MNVFCRQPLAFLQDMQAISRLLLVSLLGLCRETLNRCRKRGGRGPRGGGRRWGGAGEENLAKTDWDEGKDRSREGQPGRGGGGGGGECAQKRMSEFFGMQGGLSCGLLSLTLGTPEACGLGGYASFP